MNYLQIIFALQLCIFGFQKSSAKYFYIRYIWFIGINVHNRYPLNKMHFFTKYPIICVNFPPALLTCLHKIPWLSRFHRRLMRMDLHYTILWISFKVCNRISGPAEYTLQETKRNKLLSKAITPYPHKFRDMHHQKQNTHYGYTSWSTHGTD